MWLINVFIFPKKNASKKQRKYFLFFGPGKD